MARTVPVTSDPRPVPTHRERRVYEVRIIAEKGNPDIIIEYKMERWLLAAGVAIAGPFRDDQPIVRRVLTPAYLAANPAALQILSQINSAGDAWDAEDGNEV